MNEQLKASPCPFCGREVEVVMQGGVFSDRFWYVHHPELDGCCILEDQKFSSLRGWNHRAWAKEVSIDPVALCDEQMLQWRVGERTAPPSYRVRNARKRTLSHD